VGRYERELDLQNERAILKHVHADLGFTRYRKLNENSYGIDYALLEADVPEVLLMAEVKDRPKLVWGAPGGYYISLQKVMKADAIARSSRVAVLMIIRFKDCEVAWADFKGRLPGVIWAGREDRPGVPNAMEPHCVYPWEVWVMSSQRSSRASSTGG
jgi:hypothetical protein